MAQLLKGTTEVDRWIVSGSPNSDRKSVRLFCLSYAGGGASVFRSWADALPALDVVALQLPGRENRIAEPPISDMALLVGPLADAVAAVDDRPFAIFGHSMGARIAFELTRELRRRGRPEPAALFVSACKAPHIPRVPTPPIATIPDRLFLGMLRRMDGTPPELIEDPEFMRSVLPTLRADFAIIDTYDYADEPALGMPIRTFGGTYDQDVREDDLLAWQVHTTADFRSRQLRGGHFIVRDCQAEITRAIAEDVDHLMPGQCRP